MNSLCVPTRPSRGSVLFLEETYLTVRGDCIFTMKGIENDHGERRVELTATNAQGGHLSRIHVFPASLSHWRKAVDAVANMTTVGERMVSVIEGPSVDLELVALRRAHHPPTLKLVRRIREHDKRLAPTLLFGKRLRTLVVAIDWIQESIASE
jgi:hypothetical protein